MKELNALEKWCQEVVASWPATTKLESFNHRLVRDVAKAFRALEQENILLKQGCENNPLVHELIDMRERAEAAEAKLAEMEKQELLGWVFEDELPENYPYDAMFPYSKVDIVRMFPVFGPAPAFSLAQLVPGEMTPKQASRSYGGEVVGYRDGFNACRAAILRNIEGAK